MRQLKLIWDFRGPNASHTAEHHLIHLKEYINLENKAVTITGVEHINEMHSIAFLVFIEDILMILIFVYLL